MSDNIVLHAASLADVMTPEELATVHRDVQFIKISWPISAIITRRPHEPRAFQTEDRKQLPKVEITYLLNNTTPD